MSDTKIIDWKDQKAALLEGLSPKKAAITGVMLENQRKYNAEKASQHQTLTETAAADSNQAGSFAHFDHLVMPLVRRVMPSLLAMDLVGVQPMTMPVGMVRTLRKRYADAVGPGAGTISVTAGTEASGTVVYENYSSIAAGAAYDSENGIDPFVQSQALESQGGNKMTMDVVKQTIEAKTRKLSAVWTLESDQDAKALDGLDLENELISALADEIMRELDRELIDTVTNLAGTVLAFDFTTADGRYAGEKFAALTVGLSNLSNQIAFKTKLGGATWAIVSQNILVALRNANNRAFDSAKPGDLVTSQSLYAGNLNGSIKVYVDPYATADTCVMGFKGSELGTGLVYAPYIPIVSSGVVQDPVTFDPRLSLMTRYALATFTSTATSLGNSADYYGRSTVSNLALGF